jgi:hypothetical protein
MKTRCAQLSGRGKIDGIAKTSQTAALRCVIDLGLLLNHPFL